MRGRGIRGCILDYRDVHTYMHVHVRGCRCECFCCIYYPQWYEVSRKRFNAGLRAVFRLLVVEDMLAIFFHKTMNAA